VNPVRRFWVFAHINEHQIRLSRKSRARNVQTTSFFWLQACTLGCPAGCVQKVQLSPGRKDTPERRPLALPTRKTSYFAAVQGVGRPGLINAEKLYALHETSITKVDLQSKHPQETCSRISLALATQPCPSCDEHL
jgi:hypothetical protein